MIAMIRELSSIALLLGAMVASEARTSVAPATEARLTQPLLTVLTLSPGWGVGLKGSPVGLGALEGHYSLDSVQGDWAYRLVPKFGMSYADGMKELPQQVQFSMSLQGLVSYSHYVAGVEYWHMSNGSALGLNWSEGQNIGLDLFVLQGGYQF
jgi:hypothetical protein